MNLPAPKTVHMESVAGSVEITTVRGVKMILMRVPRSSPARFYKILPEFTDTPVVGYENDVCKEPWAEFTVEGDVLIESRLMTLTSGDGYSEKPYLVKSLKVLPPSTVLKTWQRDHPNGYMKKRRPKNGPHVGHH